MTTPQKIFVAIVAIAVAQMIFYYGQLPDTVACHFDGRGHPNGWSTKPMFFGVMFGMIGLMALCFLYFPRTFGRMPTEWISLPHRDHWLSDERRGATVRFIEHQCTWFGVATLLLILSTIQFTIDANLTSHQGLPGHFMWVFWVYMAYTVVWTVRFVGHFVRIRDGRKTATG